MHNSFQNFFIIKNYGVICMIPNQALAQGRSSQPLVWQKGIIHCTNNAAFCNIFTHFIKNAQAHCGMQLGKFGVYTKPEVLIPLMPIGAHQQKGLSRFVCLGDKATAFYSIEHLGCVKAA